MSGTTSLAGITGSTGTAQPASVTRQDQAEVRKDEFLRLLVAELGAQNPLEPMDGTQFVAQLAQFSVLEQIQGLREDLKQQLAAMNQGVSAWAHLVDLLGQQVSGHTPDGQAFDGTVTALEIAAGGVVKVKIGSQDVDPGWIQVVSASGTGSTAGGTGVTGP